MRALVVDTPAKAAALRARLSALFGYPRQGVYADGRTPAPGEGLTTDAALPRRHPDGSARWALRVRAAWEARLAAADRALVVDLTPDWDPPELP